MFPLSGAAYGLAFWYLSSYAPLDEYALISLMTFVASLAFCSWFAVGVRNLRDDVLFTLGVAGLAALQVLSFQVFVGFDFVTDIPTTGLLVCQAIWVGIAVAAWRIWARPQTTVLPNHRDRAALVPEIWSIKLSLAFGLLAIGILWPLLYALTALLELVGLDQIWDFIAEGYIGAPLSGLAFATGVLIAQEKANLLIPVRQVIGVMFRVLYPIQACGLLVFLGVAVFGGWEILIAQDFGVWWTVMAAAAGLSYLLFGAVQAGEASTLFGKIGDRIFRVTLWMAPVFAAIAIYTIWLRVADYGLTPSRTYGIWAALFVLFATIWLSVAAFGRRQSAPNALRATFGHIAICLAVTAFVVHLPLLDPVTMSARSQEARLTEKLGAEASSSELSTRTLNDLSFMATRLGDPGIAAIAAFTASYPDAMPDLTALRDRNPNDRGDMIAADRIPIFPATHKVPSDLVDELLTGPLEFYRRFCRDDTGANLCSILLIDLDGDGSEEAVFFIDEDYAPVYRYAAEDSEWVSVATLQLDPNDRDRAQMQRDLAAGAVDVIAPRYSDLKIGGQRWRQTR